MRAETANTARRNGTLSNTAQSSEYWYAAPATVAVSTRAGSTSAAPVTSPGGMRRTGPPDPGWAGSCGAGQRRTLLPPPGNSSGDFGEFTTQRPSNPAFVPQSQGPGVIHDSESGNRRQQEYAADEKEYARSAGLGHLQDHQGVARRQQHGHGQRKHADSCQQPGHVLRPAATRMVFGEQCETVRDQAGNHNKICDNGNPGFQIHPDDI